MGVKNIHIFLIACSVLMSGFFGVWALSHGYRPLGYGALVAGAALMVYGIKFWIKARTL